MLFKLLNTIFHKEELNVITSSNNIKYQKSNKFFNKDDKKPTSNQFFENKELKQIYGLYAIDGDTFVGMMDSNKVNFRLAGIDAPENGEYKSKEATDLLNQYVRKKIIFIKSRGEDKFGRNIVDVFADKEKNTFVNNIIIKNGLAEVKDYTNIDGEKTHSVIEMGIKKMQETRANINNKGIWKKT